MKRRRTPIRKKYHNRNRMWDTRQHTFALTLKSTAVIILGLLLTLSYLVVGHSCESLESEIAREETRQRNLLEALQRETCQWNRKRSPANLEAALLNNGSRMVAANPRNRIAMRGPNSRRLENADAAQIAVAVNR